MAKAKESVAPVTFYSKHPKLRLVIKPIERLLIENRFILSKGVTAEFDRGTYTTSDPEIIQALRERGSYGLDYFENAEDMAATINPEGHAANGVDVEVTRPRTKKGERAAKPVKATTADDLDDAASEGSDEE